MVTCEAVYVSNAAKAPDQTSYSYSEEVAYSCVSGYEHTTGNLTRTCTAIDKWSGTGPGVREGSWWLFLHLCRKKTVLYFLPRTDTVIINCWYPFEL